MLNNRSRWVLFGTGLLLLSILAVHSTGAASIQAGAGAAQRLETAAYQLSLPIILNLDERPFLMALYDSTQGDAWITNTGWKTDSPYCTWYGVTCNADLRVSRLILNENNLNGPIPPEIGSLASLVTLKLDHNVRWVCDPTGCSMKDGISCTIPDQIGQLYNLQEIYLEVNSLSGSIPLSIR